MIIVNDSQVTMPTIVNYTNYCELSVNYPSRPFFEIKGLNEKKLDYSRNMTILKEKLLNWFAYHNVKRKTFKFV